MQYSHWYIPSRCWGRLGGRPSLLGGIDFADFFSLVFPSFFFVFDFGLLRGNGLNVSGIMHTSLKIGPV